MTTTPPTPGHDAHDHGAEHGHDHGADHSAAPGQAQTDPHAAIEERDALPGYFEILEAAVRELMIEKGRIKADDVRRQIEILDSRSPVLGARVVARAWVDPAYKARLLADGSAACEELGVTMYDDTKLIVLENTPEVHNLVVCTLCSCYPRPVLGLPPDWYKSRAYRARAVRWPRALLAEFGTLLPEHVEIRVHDSTAAMRYLILPMRPEGTEHLNEAELAALVTRDAMIGVTVVKSPEVAATVV
jgi:nitrile hydratase alpha subunit